MYASVFWLSHCSLHDYVLARIIYDGAMWLSHNQDHSLSVMSVNTSFE